MNQSNKPEPPSITEAQLLTILSVVRESGHPRAHYIGYADKSVILGLVAALGRPNVSIMDMHDRWGREALAFWDKDEYGDAEPPTPPDWLDDIRCHFEGRPNSEILLCDLSWSGLDDILLEPATPFRTKPILILLFSSEFDMQLNNEAAFDKFRAKHPLYKWRRHEGVIVGKFSLSLENDG